MNNIQSQGSEFQEGSQNNMNSSTSRNNKIIVQSSDINISNTCSNSISKQNSVNNNIQVNNQSNGQQLNYLSSNSNNQSQQQPHSPVSNKNPLNYTRRNFLKYQQQYLESNNISIPSTSNIPTNKSPTNGASAGSVIQNIHSLQQQQAQQNQQQNQVKQSANHIQNLMQIYTPLSSKAIKRRLVAPNHSSLNRRTYTESEEIPISSAAAMYTQQENILSTSVGNNNNTKQSNSNNLNTSINPNNSQSSSNGNGLFCFTNKRGSTNTRKPFLQLSNQQANSFIQSQSSNNNSYVQNSCQGNNFNGNGINSSQANNNNLHQNAQHNKSYDRHNNHDRSFDLPQIQTPSSQIEKKNFQIGILSQQSASSQAQNALQIQQPIKQLQQNNYHAHIPTPQNNNQILVQSGNQEQNNRLHINNGNQNESNISPIHTPYGQQLINRVNITRMKTINDRKSDNIEYDDEEPTFSSIQNQNDYTDQSSPQIQKNQQFLTIQQQSQQKSITYQQNNNQFQNQNGNMQNGVNNIQTKNQKINQYLNTPNVQTPSQNNTKKYVFQQNRPSQNYSSNARSIRESSFASRASSPFQKTTNIKTRTKIKIQNNNYVKKVPNIITTSTPPRQNSVLQTENSIQNNINNSINQQYSNIQKNQNQVYINQNNNQNALANYGSLNNKNLQIQTIPDSLDEIALNFQIASRKNRNQSVRNNPAYYYNRGEKLITIQNDYEDISSQARYSNVQSSQGNHQNNLQSQFSQSPQKIEKKNLFPQSSKHSTNQQLFEKSIIVQREKQELIQKEQLVRQKFIQQQLQKRSQNGQDNQNLQINKISNLQTKEERQKYQKSILSGNSESPQGSQENTYNNQESFLLDHKHSKNFEKDIITNENISIVAEKLPKFKLDKRPSRLGEQETIQEREPSIPKRLQNEGYLNQQIQNRQAEKKEDKQQDKVSILKQETSSQNSQQNNNDKQNNSKQKWDLSEEEYNNFGDRFPKTLIKKKLLGRGGFALVWLGEDKQTKENYAVKQILSSNAHQTHIKEIWFGSFFFKNGVAKEKYQMYRGVNNLSKMMNYEIKQVDTWIYYELCGESLGSSLYELKGEGYRGEERVYRVHYKKLYQSIKRDLRQFKKLIFELAHALWLLSDQRIVHSDLKTENILVKTKDNGGFTEIEQVKLIDYGSSFTFGNLKHFSMATPEYMAPEILNFILYQNQLRHIPYLLEYLKNYQKTYVIDIWSLGCVMMEIISGIPLWMSLKTIVKHKGQELIRHGLFAAKGRVFENIIEKQIEVVKSIDTYIDEHNYSGVVVDQDLRYLVKKMLVLDPSKRISPKEVCQFLHKSVLNTDFVDITPNIEDITNQQTNKNTQSTVASNKKEDSGKTELISIQNTNEQVKLDMCS
ncbi:Serine/Threonine kinase domain protein (macronuclear) [Tetrahymena thermophila SB210]|uniref:Serine/Threonine kinase domain protein n=1 Tax=Tetrahymena thermophila (strain SB210) TaxID=312017 RepID=I7M2G2_TETTS|nr:Serine/Threonine kinase domain protein [Tetrahymena thermophila SB210]EAS00330.2 Serine/Threonine kinase domain protein [Tetrahymena thermophila SB210]|eukprot:XP_001020575.2 Serine/Threonine kinase domain protein [Tetrahymena thermophila SB210]